MWTFYIHKVNVSYYNIVINYDYFYLADGYNRSEACIVMLLQKASEAKRSYGSLVGIKSMQFGDHHGQFTDHIENNFKSLLLDCYKEAKISPTTVEYIEAYGSGIKVR